MSRLNGNNVYDERSSVRLVIIIIIIIIRPTYRTYAERACETSESDSSVTTNDR